MKLVRVGIVLGIVGVLGGIGLYVTRHTVERVAEKAMLPEAKIYNAITTTSQVPQKAPTPLRTTKPSPTTVAKTTLPKEVNLAVPFTAQAPHANWEDPYGELCEEASVLMAVSYLTNKKIPNADFANSALLAIQAFEEKRFGYYKDTNAEETAVILREHFGYKKVEVKQNPTIDDIKRALADGRLVITPLAGQKIGNPFYKPPGPLYHMLVITGYTADGLFITNDPGTRRGENLSYKQEILMNAIHDWRADRNIELGKKVVLIAG